MKFVNPGFLFALISIAIPIIIHLFNFRKFKQVYFTNVKFLKEVKQETQSKSKLKHLLVLLSRILAITFLVFAFAQPYIPSEIKISGGNNAVSIYIDNSFSMEALDKNGSLLTQAKNRAKEIVSAYKSTDRFQLITNNFEGRHQRLVNKEEINELIDEVNTNAIVKKTPEVISRQKDALLNSEERNKKIYLISDFQKSNSAFNAIAKDSSIRINLVPLTAQQTNNVFIDTCWISSPVIQLNKNIELHVRIKNISDKAVENNPLKLYINNQPKTPTGFSVDKNGTTEVVMYFNLKSPGIHNCRLELNDYPISFDDTFYFTLSVNAEIPVLVINEQEDNNYLSSLFGKDSIFKLTQSNYKNINYSSFGLQNLIIIEGLNEISSGLIMELKRFVENGGSLLVFPGEDINIASYSELSAALNLPIYNKKDTTRSGVADINFEHEIFKEVFESKNKNIDMPTISIHYPIRSDKLIQQSDLMKLKNGNIFMASYPYGEGEIYLSSVALNSNSSNFPKHALFVPTLYQIALYSLPQSIKLFYTIGNTTPIEIRNKNISKEAVYSINATDYNFETIPETKNTNFKTLIYTNNQIIQSGNYLLSLGADTISGVAFNYNRNESHLESFTNEELKEQISLYGLNDFITLIEPGNKTLSDIITQKDEGKKLWKLCIILALLFLATEIALLRFLKN